MSIVSAALVPAAPVIVPGLSGHTMPAPEVRSAALDAIQRMIDAGVDEVIVLAEADRDGLFDSTAPWGLHRIGGLHPFSEAGAVFDQLLTMPLAIGASTLRDAGWTGTTYFHALERTISADAAAEVGRGLGTTKRSVGLLLLGNGSACCTEKAPGSFHPQANEFNTNLVAMIRQGNRAAMMALPTQGAAEQLSDIRVPLQVFAGATPEHRLVSSIGFTGDFAGVYYICATFLPNPEHLHPQKSDST